VSGWSPDALALAGRTDEIQLASRRADGSLRPYVTMWMVASDDELYVRSAYGPGNGWYRRALASGSGRVRFGGAEQDVTFSTPGDEVHAALDDAYHAKYDRYGARIVGSVVSAESHASTLRLDPEER
jgi:hypothetical protein